jgi:hypothetical protein
MADPGYRTPSMPTGVVSAGPSVERWGTPWGAVWAGAFSAAAIWTVFGQLGVAVFRSAGSLNTAGMSWGMGVWSIILTGIALFVGGRVTARMGDLRTSRDAVMAGQTMFGLTAVGVLVFLVLMGARSATGVTATTAPSYVGSVIRGAGWFGWIGVLVGWLGAMAGAMASQKGRRQGATTPVRDIRSAA